MSLLKIDETTLQKVRNSHEENSYADYLGQILENLHDDELDRHLSSILELTQGFDADYINDICYMLDDLTKLLPQILDDQPNIQLGVFSLAKTISVLQEIREHFHGMTDDNRLLRAMSAVACSKYGPYADTNRIAWWYYLSLVEDETRASDIARSEGVSATIDLENLIKALKKKISKHHENDK
jgi:hypothetical protein